MSKRSGLRVSLTRHGGVRTSMADKAMAMRLQVQVRWPMATPLSEEELERLAEKLLAKMLARLARQPVVASPPEEPVKPTLDDHIALRAWRRKRGHRHG